MLKIIRKLLLQIVERIDAGNSNITEEEAMKAIGYLNSITNTETRMSKYQAYNYLGISRATFDNYVRAGLIPKGKHQQGFKELSWYKKDLDNFIKNNRK